MIHGTGISSIRVSLRCQTHTIQPNSQIQLLVSKAQQGWRKNMFMGEVYGEFSKSCCGVADRTQHETSNHRRLTYTNRTTAGLRFC